MKGGSGDIWGKTQEGAMEIKQTARHVGPEVGLSPDHKIPASGRLPAYRCSGPRGYLSFTVAVQLCGVAKPLSSCSGFWKVLSLPSFFQSSNQKILFMQKPVELHHCPVSDPARNTLPAANCLHHCHWGNVYMYFFFLSGKVQP